VISRGFLAAALAAVLLGARPSPLTIYSAPAGDRPAGSSADRATDAILPDGRIAAPAGDSVFVGTNPLAVAISPNGRYAIVANAQENPGAAIGTPQSSPRVTSGYSLAVVDTSSMAVTSVYSDPSFAVYAGVVATLDPANRAQTLVLAADGAHGLVRFFTLGDDGSLTPASQVAVTGYPASIALSSDGRTAYISCELDDRITAVDLAARTVRGSAATGNFPFGVAVSRDRVLVANGGLAHYDALASSQPQPVFTAPAADPYRSSSLSLFTVSGDMLQTQDAPIVRLDQVPDGVQTIGGARPTNIAVRRDQSYAYVTLADVDRVAIVALDGDPRVVAGLDLRLFVNAPYGTQPGAEILSRDDKRLYVALAGLNAVAVLDARNPKQLHRLGLIPTCADPSSLALSPDGRYLFVTCIQGVDGWGELQRVDLAHLPLEPVTLSALRYARDASAAHLDTVVPPLRSLHRSSTIDHVIYVAIGDASYDAIFGDLGHGNGQAEYASAGASVTPNLHALASAYALADNFYLEHGSHGLNEITALGGEVTQYSERVVPVAQGRSPLDDMGADPEDYPREGFLFNALARAGLGYRDYGGLLQLSGYRAAVATTTPHPRGRGPEPAAPAAAVYTMDVPALAALDGHTDESYPGWNPGVSDAVRAREFIGDMGRLVDAGQEPAFTYVWLPDTQGLADADRALGQIVQFLSGTPHWSSTAVFVVGDALGEAQDHVNRARSFALVVSPVAKRGYVGQRHLSVASVLKTEEELLGLPPLSLADLLASDMADFFGQAPYPSAYQATP
jgi:DNA-binding beta-propeller fold protein YncE